MVNPFLVLADVSAWFIRCSKEAENNSGLLQSKRMQDAQGQSH
jgi:hypothetical protein